MSQSGDNVALLNDLRQSKILCNANAAEVDRLNNAMTAQQADIDMLASIKRTNHNEIDNLHRENEELIKIEEEMKERANALEAAQQRIETMEQLTRVKENAAAMDQMEMQKLRIQIADKDQSALNAKQLLSKQTFELEKLRQMKMQEEANIERLNYQIGLDEQMMSQMTMENDALTEKTQNTLSAKAQNNQIKMMEYERNIDKYQARIAELQQVEMDNRRRIAEEDKVINQLRDELNGKDEEFKFVKYSLQNKETQIQRLQFVRAEEEEEIARLQYEVQSGNKKQMFVGY
jgi:hypothetical protein